MLIHTYLIGCLVSAVLQGLLYGGQPYNRSNALYCLAMSFLSWLGLLLFAAVAAIGLLAPKKLDRIQHYLDDKIEELDDSDPD